MASDGDNYWPVNGLRTPCASLQFHMHHYFPLRREGRIASAEPVCSCALSFVHFAHETAGAARTRHSLLPSFSGGTMFPQTSGKSCRENADTYLLFEIRIRPATTALAMPRHLPLPRIAHQR